MPSSPQSKSSAKRSAGVSQIEPQIASQIEPQTKSHDGGLLGKWLFHPLARGLDINSPEALDVHARIIDSKPLLLHVYQCWYREFLPAVRATAHLNLPMIEIGCGASHLEKYVPGVVKTDVVAHARVAKVVDAEAMPYANGSLRAIFLVDTLHHIPEPGKFLAEAERCLAPGGRLVMVEPSNSPLTRFIYRYLHRSETWDDQIGEWKNYCTGRLSSANGALPTVIFERDRDRFEEKFPKLDVLEIRRHTIFAYYASGGLSFRSFLPGLAVPFFRLGKWLLAPLCRWAGTAMTIDVEKMA